jgi:salicylate hydroxylase
MPLDVGQGASMAIEDALSLATMFPLGTSREEANARLRLYEKARMGRTKMVHDWALKNRPGSVPLASEGSWWFSNAVTKLNTWRVLALTAMFMQQTFGHNEIEHSEKLLEQALGRRPSLDVDGAGGRRRSSIWSFVLGEGHTETS